MTDLSKDEADALRPLFEDWYLQVVKGHPNNLEKNEDGSYRWSAIQFMAFVAAHSIARAPLVAENERLKKELSTSDVLLEECKMDWSGDVTQIKAEHLHEINALKARAEAAEAKLAALKAQAVEPVAWLIEYEGLAAITSRGGSLKKFDEIWVKYRFVSENKDAEIDVEKWRNKKVIPLYATATQSAVPVVREMVEAFKRALFAMEFHQWNWKTSDPMKRDAHRDASAATAAGQQYLETGGKESGE